MYKKGIIIDPDGNRWSFAPESLSYVLRDEQRNIVFTITVRDTTIIVPDFGNDLPQMRDFDVELGDVSASTLFVQPAWECQKCLMFLHVNAGDRVDFSKKAEPLRFIDVSTGKMGNPRKLKGDCCRFESSRILVIVLRPGGRVVVHPGGKTSSDKMKTYRYTGNEIWTVVP